MRPILLAAAMVGAGSVLASADAMAQCSKAAIPLPEASLLAPAAEFSCEFKTASLNEAAGQPGATRGAGDGDAATLALKLDYERQCYRQVKTILRDRLQQLQTSVLETVVAVTRTCPTASTGRPGSKTSIPLPDPALLTPPTDVDCEYKGGSANPAGGAAPVNQQAAQADALRVKLDYERQCYRQHEMILRNGLQLLQASVGETITAVNREEPAPKPQPTAKQQPAPKQQPTAKQQGNGKQQALQQPAAKRQPAARQQPAAAQQPGTMQESAAVQQPRPQEVTCAVYSQGRCTGRDPDPRIRFMMRHDTSD